MTCNQQLITAVESVPSFFAILSPLTLCPLQSQRHQSMLQVLQCFLCTVIHCTVCSPKWSPYKKEAVSDACQETLMPDLDPATDRYVKIATISTEISWYSANPSEHSHPLSTL